MVDSIEDVTGVTSVAEPVLSLKPSPGLAEWLAEVNASLAFTTYQANKVFLIGSGPAAGKLSVYERSFARAMGFGVSTDPAGGTHTLWLSSLYQLWRFENFLEPGQSYESYDAVFVPLEGRTTGNVDIHDICHQDGTEAPIFVVTRFNCLATLERRASFKPIWRPPFIDRIVPEDRCHLNGLAMKDGKPAFVTCVSSTNAAGSWREARRGGGVVVDVATNETIASGLTMPHSPRWYRDTLYLLQSGTGEFGRIDMSTGRFEPICPLPGFARGLAFIANYAVIGVSKPRRDGALTGLDLDDLLGRSGVDPLCALMIVDLGTGAVVHEIVLEGVVQELYDVAVLEGVHRPMMLGFKSDEIRYMIRPAPGP